MTKFRSKASITLAMLLAYSLPVASESFGKQRQNSYIPDISTQAGQAGSASSRMQAESSSAMSQSAQSKQNQYDSARRPSSASYPQEHRRFERRPLDVQSYREGYRDGSRSQRSQEALRAAVRACVVSSGYSYTTCEDRVLNSY